MVTDYKLTRPVEYEGVKYESLKLDFDAMTGRDISNAKREFEERQVMPMRQIAVLAMDTDFAAIFAARAAKVPSGVLDHVSAPDYVAITQAAINFLLFSGLLKDDFKQMQEAKEKVELMQEAS